MGASTEDKLVKESQETFVGAGTSTMAQTFSLIGCNPFSFPVSQVSCLRDH